MSMNVLSKKMPGANSVKNELPWGWLIIGILGLLAFWSSAGGQTLSHSPILRVPPSQARQQVFVSRVESVGFTVSDMDRAIEFYTRVLPFEMVSDREVFGGDFEHLSGVFGARVRVVRLRLGGEILELTEYLTPGGRPVPVDSRSNDRWFQHIAIIVADMDRAYELLRKNKVRHASTGPQTLPAYITAAAGIKAFYFKDFDNHVLEILQFPADKGAPKWHELEKSGKLFLGIDHTAIVIGDTQTSTEFYRNALGLAVAGESENYGTEQEHLNNVFGARLHITGLKTFEDGINVEFLQYLAPTDGRPFPKDTRSNDLWHWQTSFEAENIDPFVNIFRQGKYEMISTGIVFFEKNSNGFDKGLMVRDPDGHAVRIIEK